LRIRKLNYNRLSDTKTSWQSRPKLTGNQNWKSNSNWDAASCFRGLARITPNRRRRDLRPNCNVIRLLDRGADLVRSNPHAGWRRRSMKALMVWRWWNLSRCGKDERFHPRCAVWESKMAILAWRWRNVWFR